jgi:RNA polymerase sigma-70 factor (ECF subfamily)
MINKMPGDILDTFDDGEVVVAPMVITLETEDIVLVTAAKGGNVRAFEVLLKRHERRFLRIAQRVTCNREDAQDVVQKSFQKAFLHLRKFEERASFPTWVTRIVINEAAMCLRAKRRVRVVEIDELFPREEPAVGFEFPDSCPSPEQIYSQQEAERMLSFAIRQLPPGVRTAIKLCYLDERSLKESAQVMGLSVAAVKSRVLRGRRKLHQALKQFVEPVRMLVGEPFETSAHANAGSPSSAARLAAAQAKGGPRGDNSSGSCAHGPGVADPRRPWRRKRFGSFSVNRVQ